MSDHGAPATGAEGGLAEFARETGSGISAAFVLVAIMLPLGLIAFAPLGEYGVEAGLSAAFAAAIFGSLTAIVLSGPLLPNEVPRASSVFLFAAFVLRIAADPQLRSTESQGVVEILFLAALCLAVTGVIQIIFGLLRLGNVARFVPYPVVAGLMTGLAIALVIYELPEVLGTHGGAEGGHHGVNGWTLAVGLVTIVGFVFVRRRWPALPSKLIGLFAGTLAAILITWLIPSADVGPRVPFLGKIPLPDALWPPPSIAVVDLVLRFWYDLVITALAIAVVGSLDSLLAAVGEADGPLDSAHHPNRLLVALGCGNLVSSLFGGVPVAYSSHHAIMIHQSGSRKLVSSFATTITLVLLLLYGAPLLHLIPVAALSAMMLVIAVGLIDRWAGATIARARRGLYDRELIVNILLVLLVAGVTVVFGLVAAVITGLILSMGLFLAVMNGSLIRSVSTGANRGSRRVYPPEQASLLRIEGRQVKVVEVDGAIFFGTSDRLAVETMRAAEGARYLIVDLRRVTMIDASGALMLDRLARRLAESDCMLLLAHVSVDGKLARSLRGAGVFTERHRDDWFEDVDQALEWVEQRLLAQANLGSERELAIGEFALLAELSPAQLAFMKPFLDRQLFPARAALYHEGQSGDRLYLLARGAVSVVTEDPANKGKYRRVVTLAPGVIFGESAMLEGGTRAVTAIAVQEVVTYSLSRKNLLRILELDPDLHHRLMRNMLAHMSGLLRMTTGIMSDAGEPAN